MKKTYLKMRTAINNIYNCYNNKKKGLVVNGNKHITLKKICNVMGISVPSEFAYMQNEVINDITVGPTKRIKSGGIFFLLFDNVDIKMYLDLANKRKARVIFVDKNEFEAQGLTLENHKNVILLDNKIEQVGAVFAKIRKSYNLNTIAITGSVGKTTTKQFLKCLTSKQFKTFANIGNNNSYMSTANHIANKLSSDVEVYIQEVCAGAPGYVRKGSAMLRPDIFILLNVEEHHMNHYKTYENLFKDKVSIDEYLNPKGFVIANYDDLGIAKYKFKNKVLSFGIKTKEEVDFRAINIKQNGTVLEMDIIHHEEKTHIAINILGEYNAYNALAAFIAAKCIGVENDKIVDGFREYRSEGIRQNFQNIGGRMLYMDCYNACEASVLAAARITENFDVEQGCKKIAVLGGENKLGDLSVDVHKRMGNKIGALNIDKIIFYGTNKSDYESIEMLGDAISMYEGYLNTKSNSSAELMTSMVELSRYLNENFNVGDFLMLKCQLELDASVAVDENLGTSFSFQNSYYKENSIKIKNNDWEGRAIKSLGGIELINYDGKIKKGNLIIPNEIGQFTVFRIKNGMFKNNDQIEEILFGCQLKNIGAFAFSGCNAIKKITIPGNVKVVEKGAFKNCKSLEKVIIEEGCTHISQEAFKNDIKLKEIYIPTSVGNIENDAFESCRHLIIYCLQNTFAEKYAKENGIKCFLMKTLRK